MVGKECPGVTGRLALWEKAAAPFIEVASIREAAKDGSSFYSSDNDIVENAWSIETGVGVA
jgi:hypothetical protein